MEQVQETLEQLSKHFDKLPIFKKLSEKSNLPSAYFAIGSLLLILLMVILGIGAKTICYLIGFIYPAYMSFKAVESPGPDDDKQWLTYWIVFALFVFLDDWYDVFLWWLPLYYPLKLVVLVYLFWPKTRGAENVYNRLIKPFFTKYESFIDSALEDIKLSAEELEKSAKQAAERGAEAVKAKGANLLKSD